MSTPRGRPSGGLMVRRGAVAAARTIAAAGAGKKGWQGLVSFGVVLGTGLGELVERFSDAWSIPARDTNWLAESSAVGHAGRIVVGRVGPPPGGCWGVALQGRVHGYEGHAPERLIRGVELAAALGAKTLLATNAAGGLRSDMRVGELVVMTDHIDLVRRPWASGLDRTADAGIPAECRDEGRRAIGSYDPGLVDLCLRSVRRTGHAARPGVYAHCLGPSYETRAEYRMLRRFGADVVGMSTVPEMVAAGALGLQTAAVSVVTNVARPDAPGKTDAEDVCRAAAAAATSIWAVIEAIAAASLPMEARHVRDAWRESST